VPPRDDLPGQAHFSAGRPDEAGQRVQQGRLARTQGAQQGENLPLADLKVNIG